MNGRQQGRERSSFGGLFWGGKGRGMHDGGGEGDSRDGGCRVVMLDLLRFGGVFCGATERMIRGRGCRSWM